MHACVSVCVSSVCANVFLYECVCEGMCVCMCVYLKACVCVQMCFCLRVSVLV